MVNRVQTMIDSSWSKLRNHGFHPQHRDPWTLDLLIWLTHRISKSPLELLRGFLTRAVWYSCLQVDHAHCSMDKCDHVLRSRICVEQTEWKMQQWRLDQASIADAFRAGNNRAERSREIGAAGWGQPKGLWVQGTVSRVTHLAFRNAILSVCTCRAFVLALNLQYYSTQAPFYSAIIYEELKPALDQKPHNPSMDTTTLVTWKSRRRDA